MPIVRFIKNITSDYLTDYVMEVNSGSFIKEETVTVTETRRLSMDEWAKFSSNVLFVTSSLKTNRCVKLVGPDGRNVYVHNGCVGFGVFET